MKIVFLLPHNIQVFDDIERPYLAIFQKLPVITNNRSLFSALHSIQYDVSHCIESVRIRSYSGPHAGKYRPEWQRIRTLFMQCHFTHFMPLVLLHTQGLLRVFQKKKLLKILYRRGQGPNVWHLLSRFRSDNI